MKLTERELRLAPMPGESTVTLLNIEWDASSDQPQPEALPDWLDDRKLVELGFDGSVPLTHPLAGRYYRSMSPEQEFNNLLMPGQPLLRGQCQRGFDQPHIDARLMRGPPGRPSVWRHGVFAIHLSQSGFIDCHGYAYPLAALRCRQQEALTFLRLPMRFKPQSSRNSRC